MRALAALIAVGVTVLAAGSADAMSWSRPSCNEFRQSILDRDAFARARVDRTWDQKSGEEEWSAEVEATVGETILGRLSRDQRVVFTARAMEIGGVPFGFIPAEGDEIILFLDRNPDRSLVVRTAMTAREYDEYWVRRCDF